MSIINFIFIRHGHAHSNLEPELVDSGICMGMTERGLKEVGHAANAIATAGVKPACILHSPIVRAQQTAMALANVLELDQDILKPCAELRERDYGKWNGQNPDDMKEKLIAGHRPEGSEDDAALFARLETLLDEITDMSANGPVIAVSHGGIWQGLHEMFKSQDIPWLDTGDVYAVRINRVANTLTTNCLFSPAGAHLAEARNPA